MQGRLFLDVVVREGATILQLLAGKYEALLVRGNALFVLHTALMDEPVAHRVSEGGASLSPVIVM